MRFKSTTCFSSFIFLNLTVGLFFLGSVSAANYSTECTINTTYRLYKDSDRDKLSETYPKNRDVFPCQKVNRNTYELYIDGESRYIFIKAILNETPLVTKTNPLNHKQLSSIVRENRLSSNSLPVQEIPNGPALIINTSGDTNKNLSENDSTTSDRSYNRSESDISNSNQTELDLKKSQNYMPSTQLLTDSGWVRPRAEPVRNYDDELDCSIIVKPEGIKYTTQECKTARDLVSTINHEIELFPTGESFFDKDFKENYFKANFSHEGQNYSAWFLEEESQIDPRKALIREQTAQKVEDWFKGKFGSSFGPNVEVAESYSTRTQLEFDSSVQNETDPRFDRSAHYRTYDSPPTSTEMDEAKELFPNSKYKGRKHLMRLHPAGEGLCGSTANNTSEPSTKSYTAPITACALARLAQTWRETQCPDNNEACRLAFGNVSHPRDRFFGSPQHQSHTDGNCVDVRPIRTKGSGSLKWNKSDYYDRSRTRKLLELLKNMGAESVYFNDTELINEGLSSFEGGHDNHIHFCFRSDNQKAKQQCSEFIPNERICPTTRILFNHPTMINFMNGLNKAENESQE